MERKKISIEGKGPYSSLPGGRVPDFTRLQADHANKSLPQKEIDEIETYFDLTVATQEDTGKHSRDDSDDSLQQTRAKNMRFSLQTEASGSQTDKPTPSPRMKKEKGRETEQAVPSQSAEDILQKKRSFLSDISDQITPLRKLVTTYGPLKSYTSIKEQLTEIKTLCNKITIGLNRNEDRQAITQMIYNYGKVTKDEAIDYAVVLRQKLNDLNIKPGKTKPIIHTINEYYKKAELE
jgi:hypothetical protein